MRLEGVESTLAGTTVSEAVIETRQAGSIEVEVHGHRSEACRELAGAIAERVRQRAAEGRVYVLGLPTGSTPVPLYAELVRLHREEGLSFANVVTFNLDEYYGLSPENPQSYHAFMRKHLFDHVDIPREQTHIPDGTVARDQADQHCRDYEAAIRDAGGIDLMLLGIGHNGHIGFNEPGALEASRTRLVRLDEVTRHMAATAFGDHDHVPEEAITVGVATILEAREIVLMAWGSLKAKAVARAVRPPVEAAVPATYLQRHDAVKFLLNKGSATWMDPS